MAVQSAESIGLPHTGTYPARLVLVLFAVIQVSYAHVGLTFPPARKYDLDFLDNVRTPAPCGMPKGEIYKNANMISCSAENNA